MPDRNNNVNVTGPGPNRLDDEGWAWGCGFGWLWIWLCFLLLIFAGWGWGGWYGGWGGPWGWWGPRRPAAEPNATQPAAVAPGEFLGRVVTVNGQVDQVLGPHIFTLAGDAGGRDLLVIEENAKAPTPKVGERVHVTGKVKKFIPAELQAQKSVDLSKVPAAEYNGRPVLVAPAAPANAPATAPATAPAKEKAH